MSMMTDSASFERHALQLVGAEHLLAHDVHARFDVLFDGDAREQRTQRRAGVHVHARGGAE
jgi:hypothetical protein